MHDLIIIGTGPAGISCAKAALKANLNTVLIDQSEILFGGTCLNRGCIPTKYMFNAAKGKFVWGEALAEVHRLVGSIRSSTIQFFQKHGVEVLWGKARFIDSNSVEVAGETVVGKYVVIATGSRPKLILEDEKIITADELFKIKNVPEKVLIIGAGYIGLEMASLLNSFGTSVHVVEKEKLILPGFDHYLANRLKIMLQKKGIKIETEKSLQDCKYDSYDLIISSIGRSPYTEGLGISSAGVSVDEGGWVKTDAYLRTTAENIYACGDITGKKLLAYVGEEQARVCVHNIKNGSSLKENYKNIPECVFTLPSLATVGTLEDEAKAKALNYKIIQTNFLKYSSSYVYSDLDGFIQLLIDEDQAIIGCGIISNYAAELISIPALCVKKKLKLSDLKELLLIHPTMSEIIPLTILEA
ncbi:MAG: NAD(P)/FAD-dependent oxidoreductase [Candidatus Omnitrophica bacterium]|nr:NAD(P)/FAD-dependent oxidoreductase [Candidatus Omnitrophota bacterium]